MGEATLGKPLTIAEVAKIAGWAYKRMYRYLVTVNVQLDGRLLVNTSPGKKRPHWTVTLEALRQLNPAWFNEQQRLNDRVAELEEKVEDLEAVKDALVTQVGTLTREVEGLRRARGKAA